MKLKELFKDILILSCVLMFLYSMKNVVVASAAQGPSYDFSLAFGSSISLRDVKKQEKTSADACAMKCTWAEFEGTHYYAYACNYDGNYSLNVETFYEGTWKLLNNIIYENGFREAMITAYVDGTCGVSDEYGACFSGYWYPDSGYY